MKRIISFMATQRLTAYRVAIAALTSFSMGQGFAGDWPQILGPSRNSVADKEPVPTFTPAPRIAWRAECGSGYSGVAVVDGKVFLWHRVENQERLTCLNAADGKPVWKTDFPAAYAGGFNSDRGPRCVPVVDGEQVFVYGAAGGMHCVGTADGKALWSRDLREQYAAEDGYFGAGSTPIVVDDTVVVAVGGDEGAGIVGLDRNNGKTRWQATDLEADYASPIAWKSRQVIVPMRMQTVVLDVRDGSTTMTLPFGQRGLNVIGATPTLFDEHLLMTASYRMGAKLFDLRQSPPTVVWSGDDILSSQYNSVVAIGAYFYGIHGREDQGVAELRCVESKTGKVMWSQDGYGVAHLIGLKDRLISQRIDGTIQLLSANPDQFESLGSFRLPSGTYRALPALSDGVLYCRQSDPDDGNLFAVKLAN
ncbi:MAG: PQQ-binding-like beta-propeller repeat protein [Pirellulaceae bacterium]